jgi:hypothetical protein
MRLLQTFILIIIFISSGYGQEIKMRPLNKKKWQELVNEVNSKRYDTKQNRSQTETESEYNNLESEEYKPANEGNNEESGIYSNNENKDDDLFFDESKDKTAKEDETLDPKYEEDESTNENNNNSRNRIKEKNERDVYYQRDQPANQSQSSTSSQLGGKGGGGNSTWLLIIMICILAAAVIYMIIVSFSDKNKKVNPIPVDENKFENLTITKSELELALEVALKNKNYREAVRIYFIAVIKEMKDRRWIKWEKKKTNHHYINEISGRTQHPDFITATRAFEIVWYGNRTLAENDYNQLEPLFKKLINSINS